MSIGAKQSSKALDQSTVIYCGPTIKGVINQYTVYSNGLPKVVSELAGKVKSLNRLIVSIERLAETKAAINQNGSIQNVSYNEILKYQKEGE